MDGELSEHNLNLEWGCLTNLADRIMTIEDNIEGGWLELGNMVADAMTEEGGNKNPVTAFFHLYSFLFHLLYRLKANSSPRKFNITTITTILGEEFYWVANYDYHFYVWALQNGFSNTIDNDVIQIPMKKLSDKQKRAFNRKLAKQ